MDTSATNPQSSDPIINSNSYKKLLLRVTIDCEGCRKRVHKILTKLPGVQEVDINLKLQKVTVFGDVDVDFLLKKLRKSGRQVELLPEFKPPETVITTRQPVIKITRDKGKQPMQDNNHKQQNTPSGCIKIQDDKPAVKIVQPPQVPQDPAKNVVQTTGGGDAGETGSSGAKTDAVSVPEQVVQETSKESDKKEPENDESKPEMKKPEGGEPDLAEGKKHADGEISAAGKGDSGNIGKKKKKGGQNGHKEKGLSSSLSDAATDNGVVLPNYSLPANHVPPRDPRYYGCPPDLYTSQPVYAASYNTSHASTSTTTSYYAQQPADSYVYAYSGPAMEPTPYDLNAYNRQPLDSLEMFSDENPNGCSIM